MQNHVSSQQHLVVLPFFATAIFTLVLSENHNQVKNIVGVYLWILSKEWILQVTVAACNSNPQGR